MKKNKKKFDSKKFITVFTVIFVLSFSFCVSAFAADTVDDDTKASGFANGLGSPSTLERSDGIYGGILTSGDWGQGMYGACIDSCSYSNGVIDYHLKIRNSLSGGGSLDYWLFVEGYVGSVTVISGSEYGTITIESSVPTSALSGSYACVCYKDDTYINLSSLGGVSVLPEGTYVHIRSSVPNSITPAEFEFEFKITYMTDIISNGQDMFSNSLDMGSVLLGFVASNAIVSIPLVLFVFVSLMGVVFVIIRKK